MWSKAEREERRRRRAFGNWRHWTPGDWAYGPVIVVVVLLAWRFLPEWAYTLLVIWCAVDFYRSAKAHHREMERKPLPTRPFEPPPPDPASGS